MAFAYMNRWPSERAKTQHFSFIKLGLGIERKVSYREKFKLCIVSHKEMVDLQGMKWM